MLSNAELNQEMDRILAAIATARAHVTALDTADALRTGDEHKRQSALRTALEHAEGACERVIAALGQQADAPAVGRDGGPI